MSAWATNRSKRWSISGRLLDAADDIIWAGHPLSENLLLGGAPEEGGLHKHNDATTQTVTATQCRAMVIGRLKDHTANVDFAANTPVPIQGYGCPTPFVRQVIFDSVNHRFGRELKDWRDGMATYAAMLVEPPAGTRKGFAIVQMVLMRVSPRAVPLDSGLEAQVETLLATQGRWFDKPLRFDASEDVVLPDFRLLDRGKPYPMEVFGRHDPHYFQRMNAKIAYYDATFGPRGWWRWNAAFGDEMPPLPTVIPPT